MYGNGFPIFGGAVMMIFWVLVLGAIIWAVVYVARNAKRSNSVTRPAESPLDILKRRYAAGEINKEQFDQMAHNLEA